jgi:hypothetical protein
MLTWQLRQYFRVDESLAQSVVAVVVGIAIGLMSVLASPLAVFAILIGIGLLIAILKSPGLLLIGILVFSSTIISEDIIPIFEFGPGRLYLTDLMLLMLFGLIVARLLVEPDFKLVRTPLDLPMITFLTITFLTAGVAVVRTGLDIGYAITELRVVIYYAAIFPVTNLLRERRQIMLLFWGLIGLAIFVAIAMFAQFLLGQSANILPGRVESLVTTGETHSEITRIVTPGESLALTMFITLTVILVLERFSIVSFARALQVAITGLAVIITFNRNFWIGVGIALLILAYLVREQERAKLILWSIASTALLAIILLLIFAMPESRAQTLVTSSVERLASLAETNNYESQDSTLRWRNFEYQYSIPAAFEHPLFGLGMGSLYRPIILGIDDIYFDGRAYTHNAHMWILMKTGVFGYLSFVWLSALFVARSFRNWRLPNDPTLRGIVLGFTLTYIGVFVGSIVNPMFMQWYWTPVIGIMMGANEAIIRWLQLQKSEELIHA